MARGPTNLPWLPEAHSPNATSWNDTVALCTVIYNEELADVREWLHYYRRACARVQPSARWALSSADVCVELPSSLRLMEGTVCLCSPWRP